MTVSAETQLFYTRSESRTELHAESQRDYHGNPESRLHCYQVTMAIDNRYDGEIVDGAMNFDTGR